MGDPNFLATIVDDGVLMRVMIGGGSTRRGGEELGKVFDLVSEGAWDNEGGAWGWDGVDRSFDDGRGKVLNRDIGKGDTVNWVFELSVCVLVLLFSRPLEDWAVEGL